MSLFTDSRPPMPTRARSAGFTLFEMLVALIIFAILGTASAQLVRDVLKQQAASDGRGERLAHVQRAMRLVEGDVMQASKRPIREAYGDAAPALRIDPDGLFELTRAGWRNPLGLARGNNQRVAYRLHNGALLRYYWTVLDRDVDSEPVVQTLLSDVDNVEFVALDISGNEHRIWPLPGDGAIDPQLAIAGIRMRLEAEPFGNIERLWEVPPL